MRRSICYCSPPYALAGDSQTWKFIYSPATNLKKGAQLKFDLLSKGRDIDWELPSCDPKATENQIYAYIPEQKVTIQAKPIELPDSLVPQYEFVLPTDLKSGDKIEIVMGSPLIRGKLKKDCGNFSQTIVQRRRPFLLYVDPKGKSNYQDPEIFNIDIRGNVLSDIRIISPSYVSKNKRFDVIVRFEDEFGNLTNNAPEGTLVELSYENQRENLNWKLFVPETGFITIPNFYFNEPGIYRIQLKNLNTNELYFSSPIRCFQDTNRQIFWGLLHGESERFDSTESIESCLRHYRDDTSFNFFATSSFESVEETPNDIWKLITQNVAEFNENERFTSLLGFQWNGNGTKEGVRQILYGKDNKPLLRKKDSKFSSLKKLYKAFAPKEFISIPSFTMGDSYGYDFSNFNTEFERVVEIYNAWGSSECTKKEGNTRPITGKKKKCISESAEGSIREALKKNLRFGFVAGGLDDRGIYYDFFDSDQDQYSPGMTAIIAPEHSREGLMEALYNRSCYATTGERIILDFSIAGTLMGQETSTEEKPGLVVNRHITGIVACTSPIKKLEIIRNGKVITSLKEGEYFFEFAYDDMEKLEKTTINAKDKNPPFTYYYLKAIQENGHIAWSSPIWIDDCTKVRKPEESKV